MNVRDAFFYEIDDKVRKGEDLIIASADIGAPSLDGFRRNFGSRFVNVGIAEQNLIAVSAGLAFGGKKVIAYGLNPFPVTRAFDQVRNFMASMQLPITLTALNAGTCSAEAGYTHMPIENMSVMRTLRNIKTINPSDETISRMLADEVVHNLKPRYVQFDKYIAGTRYKEEEIDFEKGFAIKRCTASRDMVIVTYGIWVQECLLAGLECDLIDCFSWPVDEKLFVKELSAYNKIITVEDGVLEGGLGSMVLEAFNQYEIEKKVIRLGIPRKNGYPKAYTNRKLFWESCGMGIDRLRELLCQIGRGADNG